VVAVLGALGLTLALVGLRNRDREREVQQENEAATQAAKVEIQQAEERLRQLRYERIEREEGYAARLRAEARDLEEKATGHVCADGYSECVYEALPNCSTCIDTRHERKVEIVSDDLDVQPAASRKEIAEAVARVKPCIRQGFEGQWCFTDAKGLESPDPLYKSAVNSYIQALREKEAN
jgi:Tfp pilus assembly protein PilX